MAFDLDRRFLKNWEMDIAGTLCEHVTEQARLIHFPDNLLNLFPIDLDITGIKAASYMGLPLTDSVGNFLGHLAVMDTRPMQAEPLVQTIFRIFASRASAELQRLQAEFFTREREQKLRRLVDSGFAVQHSVMWPDRPLNNGEHNIFPNPLSAASICSVSIFYMALLYYAWQPMGGKIWDIKIQSGKTY